MKSILSAFIKTRCIILIIIFLSLFSTIQTYSQPGSLDSFFGNGGIVTAGFGVNYAALQPDGKIITTGGKHISTDSSYLIIRRFNTDGSTDTSFGIGGYVTKSYGASTGGLQVKLQPDGKIILIVGASFGYAIARYLPDGTNDSSFATNGITPFNQELLNDLTLQKDGKIIAVGRIDDNFLVRRFQQNGTPDSSFGDNGIVITNFKDLHYDDRLQRVTAYAVVVQPDGKIVVSGEGYFLFAEDDPFRKTAIARYNEDGSVDSSLIGFYSGSIGYAAIQPDDKIVIGGSWMDNASGYFSVFCDRLNPDGTRDSSFEVTYTYYYGDYLFDMDNFGSCLGIQSDGKILIGGYSIDGTGFGLVRYKTNGTPDSSFDTDGIVVTSFEQDYIISPGSLIIQPDSKIILAGSNFMTRYNADNIVPVTLTSFTAVRTGKSVLLNWQTATEINNKYFSVERSANGTAFKEIGLVKSKGNSSQLQQYSFTDISPLSNENYYRLKQVDADGHFTYSNIVFVGFDVARQFQLYPNPVNDILIIKGLNSSDKSTISIIDVSGHRIQQATTVNSSYVIDVKKLPPGSYYVQINSNNRVINLKFIRE
jgi:uncharacterized delta-60 repeat protein